MGGEASLLGEADLGCTAFDPKLLIWDCQTEGRLGRSCSPRVDGCAETGDRLPPKGPASPVPRLGSVKWKATTLWILAIALPLAIELTVKPSKVLSIVLFLTVGVAFVALLASLIWNWSWPWKHIARQIAPHLPTGGGSTAVAGETDEEFASAIDDLLDELATIDSRLTDAINANYYGYKFFLPSATYHQHKAAMSTRSSDAREVLSEVYVQADALNEKIPGGASDGIEMEHVSSPDPVKLLEIVSRAQATLRQLRP